MDLRTIQLASIRDLLDTKGHWKAVLWGDVAGMPVPDLLNILSHGKRTGLLVSQSVEGVERALGIVDGDVTFAASSQPGEGNDPREIAVGLLRLTAGAFTFLRGPAGVLQGVEPALGIQELLLDGLRRIDEAGKDGHTTGRMAG